MTALAGTWNLNGRPVSRSRIDAMLAAQRPATSYHTSVWTEGAMALGRGLTPFLPEDAFDSGPAIGGGGTIVLCADVRIDNRAELADELGIDSERLAALSDSGVLVAAYERWQEACCERVLGDFAFAAWGARSRKLVLARDPTGQRQLLYHRRDGLFAFASRASGLHALSEIPMAPDLDRLRDFVASSGHPASTTFFAGIERVEPGSYLVVTEKGVTAHAYWQPILEPFRFERGEEYVEGMREQLNASVRRRLRAVGRVGCHLSAGLDSGAVFSTAAHLRRSDEPVVAFTGVPQRGFRSDAADRLWDEGNDAATVCAQYPESEHVMVAAGRRTLLQDIELGSDLTERPVLNPCNAGWLYAINDAARERDIKVMLTGQMGNLHFSYAGFELLPELLGSGQFMPLLAESRSLAALTGQGWLPVLARAIGPYLGVPGRALLHLRRSPPACDFLPTHVRRSSHKSLPHWWRSGRSARLFGMTRMDLAPYNSAALAGWGIDQRDPTADVRLIEYCLRVPTSEYLQNGVPRSLARRALLDRLPQAIIDEPRRGYQGADWHVRLGAIRTELQAKIERLAPGAGTSEVVDCDALLSVLNEWPEGGEWNSAARIRLYREAFLRAVSAVLFVTKVTKVTKVTRVLRGEPSY